MKFRANPSGAKRRGARASAGFTLAEVLAALMFMAIVIPVAMQSGDAATVLKHLKERGIDLPQLIDADGRHAMNWRVRGVPTHFVVDAAGNVRFRVVGYATTWGLKARLWWAETFPA